MYATGQRPGIAVNTSQIWNRRRQRMRRDSKNHKVSQADAVKAKAAAAEAAIREPPPKTWSATHPAYCFTVLCPEPEWRRKPEGGGNAIG